MFGGAGGKKSVMLGEVKFGEGEAWLCYGRRGVGGLDLQEARGTQVVLYVCCCVLWAAKYNLQTRWKAK